MIRAILLPASLVLALVLAPAASAQGPACATTYEVDATGLGQSLELLFQFNPEIAASSLALPTLPTSLETGPLVVQALSSSVVRLVPQQQIRQISLLGRQIAIPITVLRPVTQVQSLYLQVAGHWVAIDFCQGSVFLVHTPSFQAVGFTNNGQLSGLALLRNFGGLTGPFALHGSPAPSPAPSVD